MTRYRGTIISGFLRQLHAGSSGQCITIVVGMGYTDGAYPASTRKYRYR
nr:hypothetical protein [uncultured Methanoregula sp.]